MDLQLNDNYITVQQLYNYATLHNYINTDVMVVLDIINRERNSQKKADKNNEESIIKPIDNTSAIDFSTLKEYSINDLLTLLSS